MKYPKRKKPAPSRRLAPDPPEPRPPAGLPPPLPASLYHRKVRLSLLFAGKPRDVHANAIARDYLQRAARFARCEMREIQPARFDPWERLPSSKKVALDPRGQLFTSAEFTALLARAEMEGWDITFLVGGADGLPPGWAGRADYRLSLSPLTLPHELARAVLAEQIYRAFATLRGHPYPR